MIVYGGGGASSRPESGSLGFLSVCTPTAVAGIACMGGSGETGKMRVWATPEGRSWAAVRDDTTYYYSSLWNNTARVHILLYYYCIICIITYYYCSLINYSVMTIVHTHRH